MSSGPILVVESDVRRGRTIVEQLIADDLPARLASSAEHARVLARACAPVLAVLGDPGSPRGALGLLEEMRRDDSAGALWSEELPVIVLGPRAHQLDALRAFDAGADDFLARTRGYLELRARVRAVLRRAASPAPRGRLVQVGSLAIDRSARVVRLDDRPVKLRRLEYELLLELAREPERVFGKGELLRAIWGHRVSGSTRTVDSHASRVRLKLAANSAPRWVINVRGVGYRLT